MQEPAQLSEIIIRKDREIERDRLIGEQWREAKRVFFQHQIRDKMIEAKVTQKEQEMVYQLFIEQYQDVQNQMKINFTQLGVLQTYKHQIQQLQQIYNSMQHHYKSKQRECGPLLQIIQLKYSTLRVIKIEYQEIKGRLGRSTRPYTISAYQFFKILSINKLLVQVVIKGVDIQQFQNFLAYNRQQRENYQSNPNVLLEPSRQLKLSIDAIAQFYTSRAQCLSQIQDLSVFANLFSQLCDIRVVLQLAWRTLSNQIDVLRAIWRGLRGLKRMKIDLQAQQNQQIPPDMVSLVRAQIFGELAFFTQIAQLSISGFCFSSKDHPNQYCAIQQIIKHLFNNNTLTSLRLNNCRYLPTLPSMNTLQSIEQVNVDFWKDFNLMKEVVENNKSLRFIRSIYNFSCWSVEQEVFNQLKTFIVSYCNRVALNNILPKHFSNIKFLSLLNSSIESTQNLSQIFPKLSNITYLYLSYISFQYQLLCLIPSPNLNQLHINFNYALTDQGIQAIDEKWPYLRYFQVQYCSNVSSNIWSVCKFKGLMKLSLESQKLREGRKVIKELRSRGINVTC